MARGDRCWFGLLVLCILLGFTRLAFGAPQADATAPSLTLDSQGESVGMLQAALKGFQARVEPQGTGGARQAMADWLRAQPGVVAVYADAGNPLVLVRFESGAQGVIWTTPLDELCRPARPTGLPSAPPAGLTMGGQHELAKVNPSATVLPERKALILSPFGWQWRQDGRAEDDPTPSVKDLLQAHGFEVAWAWNFQEGEQYVTVDWFRYLYRFGTVLIYTHGGVTSGPPDQQKVVICSGEAIPGCTSDTPAEDVYDAMQRAARYLDDIQNGRVGWFVASKTKEKLLPLAYYCIFPSFIEYWSRRLAQDLGGQWNCVVFMGGCSTMGEPEGTGGSPPPNTTMASAFCYPTNNVMYYGWRGTVTDVAEARAMQRVYELLLNSRLSAVEAYRGLQQAGYTGDEQNPGTALWYCYHNDGENLVLQRTQYGDLDEDGRVTVDDLSALTRSWKQARSGQPDWDPLADTDGDWDLDHEDVWRILQSAELP